MITAAQLDYIMEYAYVPEHLPWYVVAISGAEPFLFDDFIFYQGENRLIFIGYPLSGKADQTLLKSALDHAIQRFDPYRLSMITASPPAWLPDCEVSPPDDYYCLDLFDLKPKQKVRNMLNRAQREVRVEQGKVFGREHKKLVNEFLRSHRLDRGSRAIFGKISEYVRTESAWIFSARDQRGKLVAFDVIDFGARHCAFYMFNFASRKRYVPGASDLLLSDAIHFAREEKKRNFNLGLGINPGVTFFKTKWGGAPFLRYVACSHERRRGDDVWKGMLDKL